MEVDEDAFPDWDERCHGPMDTEENQRAYPENFIWACCDENGTAKGCEVGVHVPNERPRKRTRI